MKRHITVCLVFVMLLSVLLGGCSKEHKGNEIEVFYLNRDVTKIIPQNYALKGITAEDKIKELLDVLSEEPEDSDIRRVIPKDVSVLGYDFNGYLLTIDFSEEYYSMSSTEEVLSRAAIVRTLLQIGNISYVAFTVESKQLTDADGNLIGAMNNESFVENPGEQINSSLTTTLTLYFATADGTQLKKEKREVHYSSNISMEKLVMEQLLEGPKDSSLKAAIPTETKLITISVVDGICYVNLDDTFKNQNQEISEAVVLYSIVDSLTELPNVNKVQISINGDTKGKCRYNYDLSQMYEREDSLIVNTEQESDSSGEDSRMENTEH